MIIPPRLKILAHTRMTWIISNWRPVSQIPSICKIFENILEKLRNFFESKRLLSKDQYGFTNNWLTLHAIANFTYIHTNQIRYYLQKYSASDSKQQNWQKSQNVFNRIVCSTNLGEAIQLRCFEKKLLRSATKLKLREQLANSNKQIVPVSIEMQIPNE